jgi:hypothetical protein
LAYFSVPGGYIELIYGSSRADNNASIGLSLSWRQADLVAARLVANLKGDRSGTVGETILHLDWHQKVHGAREDLDHHTQ